MSEFNQGAKFSRDSTLSMIIGMQNDISNDVESDKYKAYQEIYDAIVETQGDMFKEFKL
jgi:hypothetical protein